jgi:hypothetical protein
MVFEVDVQPLAARRAGTIRGDNYELCPDPAAAASGGHESVEQEGVDATVPGNIDEAHKLAVLPSAGPAQAVPAHLALPVIIQEPMTEAFSMQLIELDISERAAPRVIDHRATLRTDSGA